MSNTKTAENTESESVRKVGQDDILKILNLYDVLTVPPSLHLASAGASI